MPPCNFLFALRVFINESFGDGYIALIDKVVALPELAHCIPYCIGVCTQRGFICSKSVARVQISVNFCERLNMANSCRKGGSQSRQVDFVS